MPLLRSVMIEKLIVQNAAPSTSPMRHASRIEPEQEHRSASSARLDGFRVYCKDATQDPQPKEFTGYRLELAM